MTCMTSITTDATGFSADDSLGAILRDAAGREVVERHMPELRDLTERLTLSGRSVQLVARTSPSLTTAEAFDDFIAELTRTRPDGPDQAQGAAEPVTLPSVRAEGEPASAAIAYESIVPRGGRLDIELHGPRSGNPFVEIELALLVDGPGGPIRVPGFYDGEGIYRIRHLTEHEGRHTFVTRSSAPELDGISGDFAVSPPRPGTTGPVRVHDTFHFAYANGERFAPIGTTAYAWTHQPEELQERTLRSLSTGPFNKIRMCVFPKSYIYNENEPAIFPFARDAEGRFDLERFDVEYWRQLEGRIDDLARIGVQADLILFHPYDRWGFADMGAEADDRYLRYATARLAAFENVWWSLANEYDLMESKTEGDWERFAAIVQQQDPTRHLLSIHNCFEFYDYSRPWVTHASVQRRDIYRTAENTGEWRAQWGKPVVIDECAYEGDIDQGWGNITGEEMVRRFWEGAIRGGYVGHGETYLRPDDEIWWSKGGELIGSSPDRIGFLREILEAAPAPLEPLDVDWDVPSAGIPDRFHLFYFGFMQPRFRRFLWDPSTSYEVDVIDTWNMTIHTLPGTVRGRVTVDLPGRPYMAIRFRTVEPD